MKSELASRLIIGFLFAGLYILLIYLPPYFFGTFVVLCLLISTHEFHSALLNKGIPVNLYLLHSNTFLIAVAVIWYSWQGLVVSILTLSVLYLILFSLFLRGRITNAVQQALFYCVQMAWIAFPYLAIAHLRFFSNGIEFVLLLSLLITFNDIFAYFGGKNLGKHPLAPKLSPKKTIEGSLFGFLSITWGYMAVHLGLFSIPEVVILGLIVILLAQIGDLVESKFKRFTGIKDSGRILPGHGGLLDRSDAFLLATPFFYFFLILFYPHWVQSIL